MLSNLLGPEGSSGGSYLLLCPLSKNAPCLCQVITLFETTVLRRIHREDQLDEPNPETNFVCKGPGSKYFRLCGPYIPYCGYSTLPLKHDKGHRRYVNKWAWLCCSKALFTKTGQIWPMGWFFFFFFFGCFGPLLLHAGFF